MKSYCVKQRKQTDCVARDQNNMLRLKMVEML